VKHNRVVALLASLCVQAGLDHVVEPRELEAFKCHSCHELVARTARREHKQRCHGTFSRTGPDLRIWWPTGPVLYDVTIIHATAPSYANVPVENVIRAKTTHKENFYGPLLDPHEPFVVLPARALGFIEKPLQSLVFELADAAEIPRQDAIAELSVALARGVGQTLVDARRAYWQRDA